MDIDELLLILEKCKTGKLQKVDDDLYVKLRNRIKELEEIKENAEDRELMRIDDEIRTLRRIQRKIFETRTGKIISAAWAEVCGASVYEDLENMMEMEREFFKKLVGLIREFKEWTSKGRELTKKEKKEGVILVRVVSDVTEFQGVDGKTYKLRKGDIVTLPVLNAKALIKGGMAEEIKVDNI